MKTPANTASGDSLPRHPQKLRRGAFPERGFVGGQAMVGTEAELIDFGPVCRRAFGRSEVLQVEREGLRRLGAGYLALADKVAGIAHIPIAGAVGEVVDERGRIRGELRVRLLDLVGSVRVEETKRS